MLDVTKLFSPSAVAKAIKARSPVGTPIADEFYPAAIRTTHHKSVIGIDEITRIAKAVPVVRRGTSSISIGGAVRNISFIEPQPIDINQFIPQKDINDLETLGITTRDLFVNNNVGFLQDTIRKTIESLTAQSVSGKIAFAMEVDGSLDTYEIDFGTVPVFAPDLLHSDANADLETVQEDLMTIAETVEENGYGSDVTFYAGKKVFKRYVALIKALPNDSRMEAKVNGNTITIGDYTIKRMASRYYDPATKTYKPVVADTKLLCRSNNHDFGFKYLAIDSVKTGTHAVPMLVYPRVVEDPDGYKLYGKSTPLPIPVVKAMCEATVVA